MTQPGASRFRWIVLAVFVLSTTINYLDRQTLSALAPAIQNDFGLSDTKFGLIVSVFSLPYAIMAPFAGLLIDRIGLTRGITLAVGLWSCAGVATGFTTGLGGMIACRALLGIAEAAGIPAAGKAIVTYAKAGERAVGHAMNQAAVSLGMILAPPMATFIWLRSGWRAAFVVTGILGLAWIPLWRAVGRDAPVAVDGGGVSPHSDPRLWAFVGANALNGILYSLWTNWTTKYLATVFHLDLVGANRYAWIPPVFALAGGFGCGWASLQLVRRGTPVVTARYRVCVACGVVALATLALPLAPSPAWAAAGISLSIGAVAGFSVNLYALPLDTFGATRAAFAVSMLVASYGGSQALVSGAIGWTRDHYGYAPVTALAAFTPLLACAVLRAARAER